MLTLQQLWQMEMDQLRIEQGKEPDQDFWRWSPKDIIEFDKMLKVAHRLAAAEILDSESREEHSHNSFAEAGSGIGTKLYWAKNNYALTEYGYEISEEYVSQAHELGVQCEIRDLSDMDNQPSWSAFDIVYISRPFKDDMLEARWERIVHDMMRPGATLIASFAAVKPYTWPCYYRKPFSGVWIKPVPGKAYTPSTAATMSSTYGVRPHMPKTTYELNRERHIAEMLRNGPVTLAEIPPAR
ncbi:MAG TPA: hypothetical protein VGU90_13350 [Terriglobales bacterium]|nr:hypothetical protein [Terriglobales bacterium]